MKADVALAMMAKAKKVFERDGTFLSFPLSPIAFSPEDLDFSHAARDPAAQLAAMSEFSRLVNLLPDGPLWPPATESMLWDAYRNVLNAPKFFEPGDRTATEEKLYLLAQSVLYEADESGILLESSVYQEYRSYRDAYFSAEEGFRNRRVEGELATGPAKQQWEEVEQPLLRERLEQLEIEWDLKGHRSEVEQAMDQLRRLGDRSPQKRWSGWADRFSEIDQQADFDVNRFFPSAFSPANAVEDGSWQTFTLTSASISALVEEAPDELKRRLSSATDEVEVTGLTCDFSSVGITRAWFSQEIFKADFWRFADAGLTVSDGEDPAHGIIPYFVAGLVFARRIQVEVRTTAPPARVRDHRKGPAPAEVSLGFATLNFARLSTAGNPVQISPNAVVPRLGQEMEAHRDRPRQKPAGKSSPVMMARILAQPVAVNRLALASFVNAEVKSATRETEPKSAPEARVSEPGNQIYVMALICKRVPRSPQDNSDHSTKSVDQHS